MTKNNKMKTLVFSLGLAAMTLTANNLNAQNDGSRGLFGRGDITESSNRDGETSFTVNSQDFGQNVPMGSGIVILLAAGEGYAALKRKEEQQ